MAPTRPYGQGRIRTSVARKERQIYSLLPLTTRPPVRNGGKSPLPFPPTRSWRRDLNPRPADYKSAALPTELRQHRQNSNTNTRFQAFQPSLDDFLSPDVSSDGTLPYHFIQNNPGRH